jgi:hypothetical protein
MVSGSDLDQDEYYDWGFRCFPQSLGKCWGTTLNYATTAPSKYFSVHCHPFIRRYMVRVTDSDVK